MDPNFQHAMRDMHKGVGRLFKKTLSNKPAPSNSQYYNITELTDPKTMAQENARFYIPSNQKSENVQIQTVNLTTEYCNNKPYLNYQVTWLEKKKKETEQIKFPIAVIKDQKTSVVKNSGKTCESKSISDSDESDEPVPLVKKASSMMKIPGNARCDGPCGKIVDLATTVQFGCDHVICEVCRKKCPSAALFDGSPGCCNPTCVELSRDNICSGQNSDSTCTAVMPGDTVKTHISILKAYGTDVLRTQLETEFPTTARLSSIPKYLIGYKDLLDNARFYYSTFKPSRRVNLNAICLTDTNLRFENIVDTKTDPMLFIVIVGSNIQFMK